MSFRTTSKVADAGPRIRTALGLHPQLAHLRKGELATFEELLPETRYVGEVGLDGSQEFRAYRDDQMEVLKAILTLCAREGGKILTIHSRRAVPDVLSLLRAVPHAGTFVLHWFSGSLRELEMAIAIGCWFSIGPAMTSSQKGRALISKMPRDRVITESDGPFVSIAGRKVLPWDVESAIFGLASIWGEPAYSVATQIRENFQRLLKGYAGH